MLTLRRQVGYPRRLILFAVYDVLDRARAKYERAPSTGEINARLEVFDNVSAFTITVTAGQEKTADLSVALTAPAPGLSEEGMQRALNYLADSVVQHLENEVNSVRGRRSQSGDGSPDD